MEGRVGASTAESLMEPYYQDDYATIYHADCRDVLPLKCEMVLTDPPYGMRRFETDTPDFLGVVGPALSSAGVGLGEPGSIAVDASQFVERLDQAQRLAAPLALVKDAHRSVQAIRAFAEELVAV